MALGRRMQELGVGDAAQRGRIEQLQERIRSVEAAGASAKPVQAELRAAQAALGALTIDQGVAPAGAEAEFQAAQTAHNALLNQQQKVSQSQAALRPINRQQTVRIGAGYAAASLALVATVWAWGPLGSATPDPAAGLPPAPPAGDVADGGLAPGAPVTPAPSPPSAPVFTPQPTSHSQACTNCNMTGQARCSACFGEGKRICYACNGMGTQANPVNSFQRLQCFQCNGTGKQSCTFCQYGKVQCPYCHGAGRIGG
jgi:hypothetical protein